MKSCEEIKEALYHVAFHDADQEQVDSVLEHLDTCKECKKLFSRLCAISNALGEIEEETPPKELIESVMRKVEAIKAKRKRNRRIIASFAAAAAVVVIVFAAGSPKLFHMGSMTATTCDTATAENSTDSADMAASEELQPRAFGTQDDAGETKTPSDEITMYATQEAPDGENEAVAGMGGVDGTDSATSGAMPKQEEDAGGVFYIKIPSGQTAQEVFLILFVEKDQNITDIRVSFEQAGQVKEACAENGFEYADQPYPDADYLTVTIID